MTNHDPTANVHTIGTELRGSINAPAVWRWDAIEAAVEKLHELAAAYSVLLEENRRIAAAGRGVIELLGPFYGIPSPPPTDACTPSVDIGNGDGGVNFDHAYEQWARKNQDIDAWHRQNEANMTREKFRKAADIEDQCQSISCGVWPNVNTLSNSQWESVWSAYTGYP